MHGIASHTEEAELASKILGERAALIYGDIFRSHAELLDQYDLIVSHPPLGLRLTEEQASLIGLKLRGVEYSQGLVLWAASHLTDRGVAIVLVSPSFFFHQRSGQVQKAIRGRRLLHWSCCPSPAWDTK